jgi:hypothetical protein
MKTMAPEASKIAATPEVYASPAIAVASEAAKAPQAKSLRVVQVFAAQAHECFVYPILIGNAIDIGIVRRVRR